MHGFREGDIVSGFRVRKVSSLPDYRAEGILLEHEATGFTVYYVACSDSECFFSYTAYTPPENSRGIAHIIEHTVLSGSSRYPVKDPFMHLVRNSCNTFLNALTGVDRTYFPAASTVARDFDNLFSVYTDAVFSPLLREEAFMQEGIRISSEGGLHFEGVVFSEMLGEMAEHGYVVSSASTRPLFGDSPYQYESGGDAREICELSYGEYLDAYRRFYAPANLSLFLYGDMDITDKLELLDREYLSGRDKGRRIERIGLAERWKEPRRFDAVSSAEDGDTDSSVMVSWLLGDNATPGESTLLSLMVDILLGSPGCPLYKAIAESGLGKDLSSESGMSSSYRELTFSAGFSGADPGRAEEIEDFILSTLREIASAGFDRKAVEAAIRRMEFSTKEIPGGIPQGMRLFFQAEKALTFGGDPALFLAPVDTIRSIRKAWEDNPRFFEEWLMSSLVENPHRLLSVVRKDKDHGSEIEKAIASVLEKRKGEFFPDKAEALGVPRGKLWGVLQGGSPVTLDDGRVIESGMVMGPSRDGRKISYVTDTMYFPEIADYVHDSDILFCEGMFEKALKETAMEKKHMTSYEAGLVARDSGSLKLCLQHYSPRYSDRELRILERDAASVFPGTVLTRDRMSFSIPLKD